MGRKSKQKQQRRVQPGETAPSGEKSRWLKKPGRTTAPLQRVTVWHLSAFLLVASAAFFQGMFFSEQRVAGAALVLIVGAVWLLGQRREGDMDWPELALFALAVVSVLSFLWAASRENAVLALAVWTSAFVVYAIVRRSGQVAWHELTDGALAGAAFLLVVGVLESFHAVNLLQWNLAGRLTLGLQYPDTAGALAFGLAWMALWRLTTIEDRRWRAALLALSSGMVLASMLTVSRGALLMLVAATVVGLAFTEREHLGASLRLGLIAFLTGAIGSEIALKSSFLPGLLAAAVLAIGLEAGLRQLIKSRQSALVLTGGILVIVLAFAVSRAIQPMPVPSTAPLKVAEAGGTKSAAVGLSGSGTITLLAVSENAYGTPTTDRTQTVVVQGAKTVLLSFAPIPKGTVSEFVEAQLVKGSVGVTNVTPASFLLLADRILPTSVASRFVDIAPNDLSVWQRVLFITDAFKLWAMRPLLGWGGGGWTATYRSAESFNYTSAQTHGSFTNILSSYGVVGGVLYVAFWVLSCLGVLKAQKGHPGRGFAVAGIGTLLFHSLIDFDFAYLLMVLLTVGWAASLSGPPGKPVWRPDARYLALGTGLLALLMVGSVAAHAEANAALTASRAKNGTQAVSDLNTALTFAPYDSTLWNDLAEVQGSSGTSAAASVQADVAAALMNAPHDPELTQALSADLLSVGATAQGLSLAKQSVAEAPHWATAYETVAKAELFVGDASYTHGQLKAAKLAFLAGQAELARFNRIYSSESAIPSSVNIGPDPTFSLTAGELAALLNEVPQATVSLTQAASVDPAEAAAADGWLYALGAVDGGVSNMPALQQVWSASGGLTSSEVGAIENAIRVLKPVKA